MANIIGTGSQAGLAIAPSFRLRLDAGVAPRLRVADGIGEHPVRRRFSSTMVDFYPVGGGFHLSAGGRLDSRRADRDFGSKNPLLYAPKGVGNRKGGSFRKFASAMTVGYTSSPDDGVTFGLEAGTLVEHGDPSSRELYRFARRGTRNDARFDSQQRLNPVVQASLNYKF